METKLEVSLFWCLVINILVLSGWTLQALATLH
jgi:hypothetical protein